ncbi:hypothetical protein ACIQGZ_28785 [Streptomyces sp. NPDC092296]|uniref:hypothetical protein n=1 Tax=Streptomyces sp. NPDC092296 TaxID=3366012 RepID=UPI00380BF40C
MNAGPCLLAAATVATGPSTLLGAAGLLILLAALAHLAARRRGGWRAVRRGLRREAALTAAAFAAPVRAELRYRRRLRLLVRLLRDPAGWADAERAMRGAAAVRADVHPYAALLGPQTVGVLVACGADPVPRPAEPWTTDGADPRLWWLDRADAARTAGPGAAPLLAALGSDGEHAVLLDLGGGPAVTAVDGDRSTARAVLQSLAAQLDARLPAGAVTVAAGVHDRYAGPEPAAAVAAASRRAAGGTGPAVAVCAQSPQGQRLPAGVRLLTGGGARGSALLLGADRGGALLVHGTPLRVDAVPLARAVARTVRLLPPYPAAAGPAHPDDLREADDPQEPAEPAPPRPAAARRARPVRPDGPTAPDGTTAGTGGGPGSAAADLSEPESPAEVAGVSAAGPA